MYMGVHGCTLVYIHLAQRPRRVLARVRHGLPLRLRVRHRLRVDARRARHIELVVGGAPPITSERNKQHLQPPAHLQGPQEAPGDTQEIQNHVKYR